MRVPLLAIHCDDTSVFVSTSFNSQTSKQNLACNNGRDNKKQTASYLNLTDLWSGCSVTDLPTCELDI